MGRTGGPSSALNLSVAFGESDAHARAVPLFPDHFERGCRLLPDRPSPRKTAANTKKTAPMPEESRVKSTIATMRNATPARTLPSACFDIS